MKTLKALLLLLAAHFSATASTDSTLFLRAINYSEVFEVAKKENKAVMLYFHFDQCGACRKMEKTSFIDNEVAEFYNKNFVSFEINTRKGEGVETNKIYNVRMHPTFIFLNQNGEELDKIVGACDAEEFIEQAKNALDPQKNLAYQKQLYEKGNRNAEFLLDYCYRLNDAFELDSLVINEYLNTQSKNDLSKEENIKFIYEFMFHKHDVCIGVTTKEFRFMSENKTLFTPYFETEQIESRLMFVTSASVHEAINNKDTATFWERLELLKKFDGKEYQFKEIWGGITSWITTMDHSLNAEMHWYDTIGEDEKYKDLLLQKMKNMWEDPEALNSFAWKIYLSEEKEEDYLIAKALECVQRSIVLNSNYNNTDTHAALLFKVGKYNQAIKVAEQAIEIAKLEELDFSETTELIEKIKRAKE